MSSLPAWGWLTLRDLARLTGAHTRTLKRRCAREFFGEHQRQGVAQGGVRYEVHIDSPRIAPEVRKAWEQEVAAHAPKLALVAPPPDAALPPADLSIEYTALAYARLTHEQRKYVDKWHSLLWEGGRLDRAELDRWLAEHGISPRTWRRKRKRWFAAGATPAALARSYRGLSGTIVPDDLFAAYQQIYLTEAQPSESGSWKQVLGLASEQPGFDIKRFPSVDAFQRRLLRDMSASTIFLMRNGPTKWRTKYGYHIMRDYSTILAGTTRCCDHAQSDVAVLYDDGTVGFPWYTVWIDVKSQMWLGWCFHREGPNSDHVVEAFYNQAIKYNLPTDVIIDNGKDFLARDVSGGRSRVHYDFDESYHRSLFGGLRVETHFARIRNAQAKIIERGFGTVNSLFSRFQPGYRGPSIAKRPESLKDEINANRIMTFEEWQGRFETFIASVLNHETRSGKAHEGKSAQEIWDAEYALACENGDVRSVAPKSLALFCRRTTSEQQLRANGFFYAPLGCWYFEEWMPAQIGRRAYLRLDRGDVANEAAAFDAETHAFLGPARAVLPQPIFARSQQEILSLRKAIALQTKIMKDARAGIPARTDIGDPVENRVRAVAALSEARGYAPSTDTPVPASTVRTAMDGIDLSDMRGADAGRTVPPAGQSGNVLDEEDMERTAWAVKYFARDRNETAAG